MLKHTSTDNTNKSSFQQSHAKYVLSTTRVSITTYLKVWPKSNYAQSMSIRTQSLNGHILVSQSNALIICLTKYVSMHMYIVI